VHVNIVAVLPCGFVRVCMVSPDDGDDNRAGATQHAAIGPYLSRRFFASLVVWCRLLSVAFRSLFEDRMGPVNYVCAFQGWGWRAWPDWLTRSHACVTREAATTGAGGIQLGLVST
jgi:hypothetical protein